jgi:hypothetical protein
MRNFPSEKALVAAYWRKLIRSIGLASKKRGSVAVRRVGRVLRTPQRRASRSKAVTGIPVRRPAH